MFWFAKKLISNSFFSDSKKSKEWANFWLNARIKKQEMQNAAPLGTTGLAVLATTTSAAATLFGTVFALLSSFCAISTDPDREIFPKFFFHFFYEIFSMCFGHAVTNFWSRRDQKGLWSRHNSCVNNSCVENSTGDDGSCSLFNQSFVDSIGCSPGSCTSQQSGKMRRGF
jgi:hypothetical protein